MFSHSSISSYLPYCFFLIFICFTLASCIQEEEPSETIILEEGRCQFSGTDGIAEINGINRWLNIGEVQLGYGDTIEIYQFNVGGFRPDCSLFEQVNLILLLDRNSIVDGTYEITPSPTGMTQLFANQTIGTAIAEYVTRVDNISPRQRTELTSGTIKIKEVEFFRFEIEIEATTLVGDPITVKFTNPPQ